MGSLCSIGTTTVHRLTRTHERTLTYSDIDTTAPPYLAAIFASCVLFTKAKRNGATGTSHGLNPLIIL